MKKKLLIILGILVILYCLYLLWAVIVFGGGSKDMEDEIYYIPNECIGEVYILFNQKDGLEKEFEKNKRVYRIPPSGILKTKFKTNTGWINHKNLLEFYMIDSSHQVTQKLDYQLLPDSVFFRNNAGEMAIMGYQHAIGSFEGSNKEYSFLRFVVDTVKLNSPKLESYDMRLTIEEIENWNE